MRSTALFPVAACGTARYLTAPLPPLPSALREVKQLCSALLLGAMLQWCQHF